MKRFLLTLTLILSFIGTAYGTYKPLPVAEYYGVSWNETADSYARTGVLKSIATGTKPADFMVPIQASMRRCVMNDSGVVQYYLDSTDSTKKADGSASVLDGTDGQVVVEIPKFYVRYSYSSPVHTWDISFEPLFGFTPHPAFFKDGAWVTHRYMGAYEGSMYDASATAMVGAADIVTGYTIAAGDLLCSVSGQYPKVNETRADYRTMASQRGAGWRQQDWYLTAAVQLLYLVEYADFDSQTMIGDGRTMFSSGSWIADNQGNGGYIGMCGYSNSDGNTTNATDRNGTAVNISAIDTSGASYQDYMTYRGIENFWGNVWQWLDGANVWNFNDGSGTAYSRLYACNNEALPYADDTSTGYTYIGDLWLTDGYAGTLAQTLNGFLPSGTGGSSVTGLCDYYYTYYNDLTAAFDDWRVVGFGGNANSAVNAGAFYVNTSYAWSTSGVGSGGRLCF